MRRQTGANDRASRDSSRRSNKRISAMIDIEQRSLRAFEQDRSSLSGGDIQIMRGVGDEWRETFRQH